MEEILWKIPVAVAVVEAVVEICAEGEIFEPIREWLAGHGEKPRKIGVFVRCPYCMSVWAGVGAAYLLQIMGMFDWMGWGEPVLWGFLIHRASNIWHEVVSRHQHRIPFTLFFRGSVGRDEPVELPDKNPSEDKK
jgi:hypothetical protein